MSTSLNHFTLPQHDVLGSSKNPEQVSFSIKGDGIDCMHCRFHKSPSGVYTVENLSRGFGTWIKLRYVNDSESD